MIQKRDFAELIEILSRQKKAYVLLLSLSLSQRGAFEKGGATALLKVISAKHEVIGRMSAVDARLSRYTAAWEKTIAAFPDQARREIADLTEEIAAVIDSIMTSERAIAALVTAAKDAIGKRVKSVTGGSAAVKAYAAPALAGAGRFLDREG